VWSPNGFTSCVLRFASQPQDIEGNQDPDRNAQFEFIAAAVVRQQRRGQPVVSVDTKKKEWLGNYRNSGGQWCPKGTPVEVQVHDFAAPELGKAIPYGVYDLTALTGWVSIGVDHDTDAFATTTIGRWWRCMGRPNYPKARELLITADGGGSNALRSRLWKVEPQKLANRLGLTVRVCQYPAGHEQVEQDRASPVQPHLDQLAWPTADKPGTNRAADRSNDDQD
jgi:hypothetical protein